MHTYTVILKDNVGSTQYINVECEFSYQASWKATLALLRNIPLPLVNQYEVIDVRKLS